MQHQWSRHLRLLILFLVACTTTGLFFGVPVYALAAGLLAYLWWTMLQARRLFQWLGNPDSPAEPPQSIGLWGDIFDGMHKLHQKHLRRQERLRARVSRARESTNAMHDGVIMTDPRGSMEWWNGAAEQLLGLRRQTDQGQLIQNLIRMPAFQAYFDSRDYREPLEIRSPSRPHIHLQIQISLFGDDDRLIVVRDVTRLFHLEQMRRDFVGNVSHEMRTPLTVISGYLETMEDHASELPGRWQRAIHTMAEQSARMEALITDLILLSRIEIGEETVRESLIDVAGMVRQICRDAEALSADRQHRITTTLDESIGLRGDDSQLRSAFSNLIFNAVKYTPAGGEITVTWERDRDGGHLSVRDNGIGIDPVHIPRLTERFYRADPSRHKETGGTGLGLAIVKHVLLNHDARLEIRSWPGKGSRFVCHFPTPRLADQSTQ